MILTNGRGRLFDGTRWQSIEPELDASAGAHLEVFFGRDNEPRLMGYTALESGAGYQKRYLRHRRGAWQPALDEIGPLGGAKGALYGVLGHDDPEVVCLTGLSCIVKRVSGWKTVSAHPAPARVLLGGGSAWALHRDRIERLDESDQKQIRWVELTPERAWDEPSGLWDEPGGAPWVLEEKNDVLYQLIDGQWRKTRSEVRGPKALAGPSRDDLWLVGTGGAAHFDGRAWSSVPEVLGPLAFVVVAKNEIWLAGASGVFRGAPAGT